MTDYYWLRMARGAAAWAARATDPGIKRVACKLAVRALLSCERLPRSWEARA